MKILQQNVGLLTNAEVLSVLRDRGSEAGPSGNRPLASSEKILLQQLSEQPRPDLQQVQDFMKVVQPFDLTRCACMNSCMPLPCRPPCHALPCLAMRMPV